MNASKINCDYIVFYTSVNHPKQETLDLFNEACKVGNLNEAESIANRFDLQNETYNHERNDWLRWCGVNPQPINKYIITAFQIACQHGHLHIAKWLSRRRNPSEVVRRTTV